MILVTGATGQIGTELVAELRKRHGSDSVVAMGHKRGLDAVSDGPTVQGDVREKALLKDIIERYRITTVYHLASLLSATGEQKPQLAWDVNVNGLKHVLDLAVEYKLRVFWPSSIAVFGPTTPDEAPQRTVLEPTTMYGVTKVTGENLCHYYWTKYGVDVRSIRYPGLISWKTPPGGGTTDYAVAIFHEAKKRGAYDCFVKEQTKLPMMYMDDAIRGTLELMDAPGEKLTVRTSYNVGALSFTAKELADEVAKRVTDFTCTFTPDERQAIADSWPSVVRDDEARRDWGWQHAVDLPRMTDEMLTNVKP